MDKARDRTGNLIAGASGNSMALEQIAYRLADENATLRAHQAAKCGNCGEWMPADSGTCPWCEWKSMSAENARLRAALEEIDTDDRDDGSPHNSTDMRSIARAALNDLPVPECVSDGARLEGKE